MTLCPQKKQRHVDGTTAVHTSFTVDAVLVAARKKNEQTESNRNARLRWPRTDAAARTGATAELARGDNALAGVADELSCARA